jgi:hypothetical protein
MIRITKDMAIESNSDGYTIGTPSIKKEKRNGKIVEVERLDNAGYYTTLTGVLKAARERFRRGVLHDMDKPLNEALNELREREDAFEQLLQTKIKDI